VQVDLSRDRLDFVAVRLFQLAGVTIEPIARRNYRAGSAMAHVLGYMSEVTPEELERLNVVNDANRTAYYLGDAIGRRGVERAFESSLRGVDGLRKEVVNARGEVMREQGTGRVMRNDVSSPAPGNNLVLSIDGRLQAEAENAFPGKAGALIALDPQTGFIRAIVSRPAFDSNLLSRGVTGEQMAAFAADPLQPMVFRAAAEHYHPGSTFKPITLLAGLKSGSFTPHTVTNCPGGYRLGNRTWRCHKESGHGPMDARDALQKSCDTYFYRIADTIGIDPIAKMGRLFGLGSITELGVAAEVPGIMPDSVYHQRVTPGGYTKGMALNTAIGQGDVNMTPLQMAVMYAAIANGGSVYQPQVVQAVETPGGEVKQSFKPHLVRQIPISAEQQHLLIDALTAVVNEPGGTAFRSRLANVTVAGKTGTAQVSRLGAVRLKKEQMDYFDRDHAWFAAFAPAEDPELVVVVLNEHGGHGGSDAAPAAAALFKKFFELKASDAQAFGPDWRAKVAVEAGLVPKPLVKRDEVKPDAGAGSTAAVTLPDAGRTSVAGDLPRSEEH
jgi:penicillin-binding protein 2